MQFYVGDWRKDPGVQALGFHERGVWFEMICLMHESEERGKLMLNGLPMPDDALARLLGLDKQNLTTTITLLLSYGVASRCDETGAIICRRMIRDENLRKVRAECGKQGGNPVLVKQKSTTKVKQKSTPSSSSSSSVSTTVILEEPLPFSSSDFLMFWQNWNQHLIEKKKPLKPTARKQQLAKLKEMGEARAIAALKHSMANNWQGIFEPDASKAKSGGDHGTRHNGDRATQEQIDNFLLDK